MRDALMRLLEPPIEALGYELVDLEYAGAGGGGILRIYIDRLVEGPGGQITVDDCARVSQALSRVLETEDPIKGHYTLEVSSPGFDRILRTRAHFERFSGARIAVAVAVIGAVIAEISTAGTAAGLGHEIQLDLDYVTAQTTPRAWA